MQMSDATTNFRASKLAAWEVKAAEELRRLFNEHSKLTQKEFGRQFEIGSAGMVSQYLGGKRPLGLAAAIKFATGLGVDVEDISPNLAAQRASLARSRDDQDHQHPWPFLTVTPEQYAGLSDGQRQLVEAMAFNLVAREPPKKQAAPENYSAEPKAA